MKRYSRFTRTLMGLGLAGCTALAATGCESAGGTAFLSEMFGMDAAMADNPRQAAAWSVLSNTAKFEAQRQAAEEVRRTPQTIRIK